MRIKTALLVCFLLPFAVVSIYNQPAIDDFWSANTILEHGRMGTVVFYFQTVSARFFSNFMMSLLNTLPAGSLIIFKIWPIAIMVLLFGSSLFFFKSILRTKQSSKQALIAALMFVALHIANIRVLFEGLYWMSASVCYQLAICVFLVGIGALLRSIANPSWFYGSIAVVCSLLLPGSAETLHPIYIATIACILIFYQQRGYPVRIIIACFAAALFSFAIVFFSQGNNARIGDTSQLTSAGIFQAFYLSARAVGYYWLYWLTTPINLAALVIVLPFLNNWLTQRSFKHNVSPFYSYVLGTILFVLCIITYFPQILFEADKPSPRLTTLVLFFTAHVALVLLSLIILSCPAVKRFIARYSGIKNFKVYAWSLFFVSAFTSTNFLWVVEDLAAGSAYAFNKEANQRLNLIKQSNADTVYVSHFVNWPHFIQIAKKENYSFEHMDRFFGKTIVYRNP